MKILIDTDEANVRVLKKQCGTAVVADELNGDFVVGGVFARETLKTVLANGVIDELGGKENVVDENGEPKPWFLDAIMRGLRASRKDFINRAVVEAQAEIVANRVAS